MEILTILLVLFIFLIALVIISTAIKIGLIITNRHNYDSKLLIIPSILSMILWSFAILTFYLNCENTFTEGIEDMILTIVMSPENIENKSEILTNGAVILVITVILQSFTYYAINIDYKKIWGYIRFKIKQILKIKPKKEKNAGMILNEENFSVPFYIALLTSILTFAISILIIFGLYKLGIKLSEKIIEM